VSAGRIGQSKHQADYKDERRAVARNLGPDAQGCAGVHRSRPDLSGVSLLASIL